MAEGYVSTRTTTATLSDDCPFCHRRTQQLQRLDHRPDGGPEHRLCYTCGESWDVGGTA